MNENHEHEPFRIQSGALKCWTCDETLEPAPVDDGPAANADEPTSCECGDWDEVHGMRVALIRSARSIAGVDMMRALDPHDAGDRRIISSLYASEALDTMRAAGLIGGLR